MRCPSKLLQTEFFLSPSAGGIHLSLCWTTTTVSGPSRTSHWLCRQRLCLILQQQRLSMWRVGLLHIPLFAYPSRQMGKCSWKENLLPLCGGSSILSLCDRSLSLGSSLVNSNLCARACRKTPHFMVSFMDACLNISTPSQGNQRAGASLPKSHKETFPHFGEKEKREKQRLTTH